MPSPLRNGDAPFPAGAGGPPHRHFHSAVAEHKIRRLNALILLLRLAAFCFSLAAAVFMSADSSRSPTSPSWLHFHPFRFVFAANGIVALYSLFEMGASIWEILKGATLLPESLQLWFDFSHDQVFAYILLSAEASGLTEARGKAGAWAAESGGFCLQSYISVGLGFAGFAFLALSTLLSAFRVASYIITGSPFHF
ncbi:CASP-like protein 4C1 isoform X2 [Phoenix dactylifera]|uniref:CASP-like protein n=1 Tax=Phoenix dactylifera TaxID=42345 RepID=A0A8B9AZZ1_PHODC|nr:CASP-like protein 4C1 isoform X2 [Phoenix dactylifera]XP_038989024.1 CASP-like protein 4C1 isoform X2 [Phoenix dactylifera]